MSNLQLFNFEKKEIRVIEKDGEPWWVAKDIAETLGYEWKGMSGTMPNIPIEWTGSERFRVRSENGIEQERELGIISEQGLYFFLGRSDKPLALPFQKWIAGEVIPSIRKKGFYAVPGSDRQEQDEWKKNFPYPFLLLEDAAVKMREMRLAMNKGAITVQEWRRVVLGDFGKYAPCADIIDFANNNLTITGNISDYVRIRDLYNRFQIQTKSDLTQQKFTRQIKAAYPTLVHKQMKLNNYPVLCFCGCKLKNILMEVVNA
jgi:prophage antirepressor-like protein